MRGRTLFAAGSLLLATIAGGAACGAFESAPEGEGGRDAAADATGASDAPVTADGPSRDVGGPDDGGSGACEFLVGTTFTTATANVLALAADSAHVYWSESGGVFRASANQPGIPERVGTEAASHIVVGASFVAWRTLGGAIRTRPQNDLDVDASSPSSTNATNGLAPRGNDTFLVRRSDHVMSCSISTCGQTLDHGGVTGIVAAGSGFDYLAPSGAGSGVFHCPGGCGPDSGTLIANASAQSSEIASDIENVFWADKGGALRKVPRLGGPSVDLITGLADTKRLFIDTDQRLVVATLAKGIFRGPKTGCSVPSPLPAPAPVVGAAALAGNTVWYAEGNAIMRVAQ